MRGKAEISYFGEHSVQRRFISERRKDDAFASFPSQLEPSNHVDHGQSRASSTRIS
jgi:hypothetical protein